MTCSCGDGKCWGCIAERQFEELSLKNKLCVDALIAVDDLERGLGRGEWDCDDWCVKEHPCRMCMLKEKVRKLQGLVMACCDGITPPVTQERNP